MVTLRVVKMHPPLYQNHPLCKEEVEALVRCHIDNPVMKFFNVCAEPKRTLDMCFKEEKKLRKKLNLKVSTTMPHGVTLKKKGEGSAEE